MQDRVNFLGIQPSGNPRNFNAGSASQTWNANCS